MKREEVREYLVDFQEKTLPKLVKRELKLSKSKKVKSIIGPRRAGKTYFMYQKMQEFIKEGVSKKQILYLNFEDPRLIELTFKDIMGVLKLHWQLYPKTTGKNMYIFIDEPQNIEKWESAIRTLHDQGFHIFLSGSSSKLLSREIATSLRGRTFSYTLLPFSFSEFLKAREFRHSISWTSSKGRATLLNLLDEYLTFGGFPEVVSEENEEDKTKTLIEYLDLVIYRDLVERYSIENTKLVKWIIKSLLSSFSKEFSANRLYNTLKSQGLKLSKNTLYSYLSMLEEALFVFFLKRFDYSIKKRELSTDKVYLCDVGFNKLVGFSRDAGKRIENVVFLELRRRRKPGTELFYYKTKNGYEVDFVVKQGRKIKQLIQVCQAVDSPDTEKREIRALVKAGEELKCNNMLLITAQKKGRKKLRGKTIKYTQLHNWLLES